MRSPLLHNDAERSRQSPPMTPATDPLPRSFIGSREGPWMGSVLPAQLEISRQWTPQQFLMDAILESGIVQLRRCKTIDTPRGRRLYREALEWFQSGERRWPCSFINICLSLGLDEDRTRACILADHQEGT